MKRKAMVWWGATAAAAVAVAIGAFAWAPWDTYSPGPKPRIPGVNGVPVNGPIPPTFDEGEPAVAVGQVGSDWTIFLVQADPEGPNESVKVMVGETASAGGVSIALCAVWYNPGGDGEQRQDIVGARLINPSMSYFVLSRDGSTPVCP